MIKTTTCSIVAVTAMAMASLGHNLLAKPLPPPSADEALDSPWIVTATYTGYKRDALASATSQDPNSNSDPFLTHAPNLSEKGDYWLPIIAYYRIDNIIKSPQKSVRPTEIKVDFSFDDNSICIQPENWHFRESMMPEKGSKWILFLKDKDSLEVFKTYRGDYGRWEATRDNLQKVREGLKSKPKK